MPMGPSISIGHIILLGPLVTIETLVPWPMNIFLLSPDQEFPQEGKGKTSRINYGAIFAFLKELLIRDWENSRLKGIIKQINNFIFERTSHTSHHLTVEFPQSQGTRLVEDFSEEMRLAQLGLAAAAEEEEEEDLYDNTDDNSVVLLTRATGTVAITDLGAPGPPASADTIVATVTAAASSSSLISGLQNQGRQLTFEETEVVEVEENESQPVKRKAGHPKKVDGDHGPPPRRGGQPRK
ncbi:hypothetical protein M405DRAFT_867283 [Rhizopogon salebrosus TDB-379]|nr:hypothetical protein M405DRAFT_867283 [Rhizopogon salebrosus TDB-379]